MTSSLLQLHSFLRNDIHVAIWNRIMNIFVWFCFPTTQRQHLKNQFYDRWMTTNTLQLAHDKTHGLFIGSTLLCRNRTSHYTSHMRMLAYDAINLHISITPETRIEFDVVWQKYVLFGICIPLICVVIWHRKLPANSPHKRPVTRKCFLLMTSSWKRFVVQVTLFKMAIEILPQKYSIHLPTWKTLSLYRV